MSVDSPQILCTVRLVPSNNYFIKLPRSLSSLTVTVCDVPVVQLLVSSNTGRSLYCTVGGRVSDSSTDVVEASPKVGLEDQEVVVVRRPPESLLGQAVKVVVAPEKLEDWQILRLNETKVELAVMEQVRVVQPGQKLKISLGKISLVLRVMSVSPEKEAVILQPLTEFHVDVPQQFLEQDNRDYQPLHSSPPLKTEPRSNNYDYSSATAESGNGQSEGFVSRIMKPLSYLFPANKPKESADDIWVRGDLRKQFTEEPVRNILRVECEHHRHQHPYISYIPSRLCPPTEADGFIAQLSLLPRPGTESKDQAPCSVIVFVKPFAEDEKSKLNKIYLSETLMKWKGIPVTSQVLLESMQFEEDFLNNITDNVTIITTSRQKEPVSSISQLSNIEELESRLFPVPSILESFDQLFVISQMKEEKFVYLSKNCKVNFKWEQKLPIDLKSASLDNSWYVGLKDDNQSDLHHARLTECRQYLRGFSGRRRHSNILVTGSPGTGKTTFIKQISDTLGSSEKVASRYLNCVTLKGKRFDAVRKMIESLLEVLEYEAPGLLLLDNLDCLAGKEEEDRPDELSRTLATWLRSVLTREGEGRYTDIAVLATAQSTSSLHDILQSSRGSITFRKQINLQLPNREEIQELLRLYTGDQTLSLDTQFLSLAEGFYPLDIRQLVEKAVTRSDLVTSESLTELIKEFTPVSKWGQNLSAPSRRNIDDVGSLHSAKAQLVQTLLWPSKYPALYTSCGVRTPRGILLYGAPGTGKTLLAEAVSSHTGLNFIPVRGPELLSKYIGASEANVRSLFSRAQAARPCIIFFDEFESLAPRRGQDSTGVTDRSEHKY